MELDLTAGWQAGCQADKIHCCKLIYTLFSQGTVLLQQVLMYFQYFFQVNTTKRLFYTV